MIPPFQTIASTFIKIKPRYRSISVVIVVSLVVMIGHLAPLTAIRDTCSICPIFERANYSVSASGHVNLI